MSSSKKVSPAVKIFWGLALLILLLWIIPTAISYYKGKELYSQKVEELNSLDSRMIKSDAKFFHLELFKKDAKQYFDRVDVIPTDGGKYKVIVYFSINSLSKFYKFFKNISLNYRVLVDDNIFYEEDKKLIKAKFTVRPY